MKYLIVGLGNIGPEYHETRHVTALPLPYPSKDANCYY